MMMPANFSAVAENEMTYVVGGSLVDVLAPAMTTANWQNVSTNVIKIVGNAFLAKYTTNLLGELFDGNYVPGDVIGYSVKNLDKAYNKGYDTFDEQRLGPCCWRSERSVCRSWAACPLSTPWAAAPSVWRPRAMAILPNML